MPEMNWRCDLDVQDDGTVHVWPYIDTQMHMLYGVNCACCPKIEMFPNGAILVVHNEAQ